MLAYLSTADRIGAASLLLIAVGMLIYVVRTGPPPASFHRADRDPIAHVRPLPPRPYDWARDEPRSLSVDDVCRAFDVPRSIIGDPIAVFRPESFVHLELGDGPELAR